ncbi:unnamed protein product [Hydatigera taeniaeformis]|uniref:PP1-binding domain-containing protein n=1 Tax=Hydatigena taeniaeformis TaxID=6205 RepID=A0A0R3WPI1_HYDTA|nr:unnamed protein product [Hydatigera taeniaeformis]
MVANSPRCISGVSSFPRVMSVSPKPSPLPTARVKTPTLSSQRRGLSTKERYGPTPSRPEAKAPAVSVERHPVKRPSSKCGAFSNPIGKRGKANEIPTTSMSPNLRGLRRSTSKEMSQTNNSSYYSLNINRTGELDLFDLSSKSPHASPTLLLSEQSSNIIRKVNFSDARDVTPCKNTPSSAVSQHSVSNKRKVYRNSLVRRGSSGRALSLNSTVAKEELLFSSASPKPAVFDQDVEKSQKRASENDLQEAHTAKKGVQFGPSLRPEQFDSRLPASTPVRRGELPPRSSIKRTCTSIVKHRRSTSMPPSLKEGGNISSKLFTPQNISAGLRTKSNLRALSRSLMDSFIDDSTAALKSLATGNLNDSAFNQFYIGKRKVAVSPVSSPEFLNEENGRSSKSKSAAKRVSNIDIDRGWISHDTPPLPSLRRTSRSAGSVDTVSSERREFAKFSRRTSSCASRSRNAEDSQASLSVASAAVSSRVKQSTTGNTLSNSPKESHLEDMGTLDVSSPGRRPVVGSVDGLTLQSPSRLSSTRTPVRVSRTVSSPSLPEPQEIVGVPIFSFVFSSVPPRIDPLTDASRVEELSGVSGIFELTKTSNSVFSPTLTGLEKPSKAALSDSSVTPNIRYLLRSPKSASSSRLSAVRKFAITSNTGPASDLIPAGNQTHSSECFLSPRLLNAQKLIETPMVQDLQEQSDTVEPVLPSRTSEVPRSVKKPKLQTSPRLSGVCKLVKTSKRVRSPRLSDVQRLLQTPVVKASPRLSGVPTLMETPEFAQPFKLSGVRTPLKTPKLQASSRLSGVRKSLKTPKSVSSPRLSGVRRCVKTPGVQASPRLSGLRKSVRTSMHVYSPELSGIAELITTPKSPPSRTVSGLEEIARAPGGKTPPEIQQMDRLINVSGSPSSGLHGLQDLIQTSNASSLKSARLKRSTVTHLPSPQKRRRLQKLKNVNSSLALSVRQTRSRAKAAIVMSSKSNAVVAVNSGEESDEIRKTRLRKQTIFVAPTKRGVSSAPKGRRKQLSTIAESLSPQISKPVQQESVNLKGIRAAKSKSTKGVNSKSSPQQSVLCCSGPLSDLLDDGIKGGATKVISMNAKSRKVGNRRAASSRRGKSSSSPLLFSTVQERDLRTLESRKAAIVSALSRRRQASTRKLPTPQRATVRKRKGTAPRGLKAISLEQKGKAGAKKKVQFPDSEILKVVGEASPLIEGVIVDGALTAVARRKRATPSKIVKPQSGVRGRTRQKSVVNNSAKQGGVVPSNSKSLRRGRAKK